MSSVTLGPLDHDAHPPDWLALGALLQDAVTSGASLGFWSPLGDVAAAGYWEEVRDAMQGGHTRVIVSRFDGAIVGCVVITAAQKESEQHRADVAKLMVHTEYRRHGLGRRLMEAAETEGRKMGKSLLVLDTRTGDPAEILYVREGWRCAGVVPRFTTERDGTPHDCSIFYKHLG